MAKFFRPRRCSHARVLWTKPVVATVNGRVVGTREHPRFERIQVTVQTPPTCLDCGKTLDAFEQRRYNTVPQ
jgi:hypothetical protein